MPENEEELQEASSLKVKRSLAGFTIYSNQEGYEKYNYCPYSGEELEEEEV